MPGFQRAVAKPFWLRLALDGPAGSGKTWTGLEVATFFAAQYGQVPAYIDTERGSASKYAADFTFDVIELKPPFHPDRFVKGIALAVESGYKVLVIDSLSHAWNGPGGLLEIVDQIASRMHGNSYAAWKDATPIQTRLIDALTGADCHIIACMRAKMEYTQEKDERGRTQIQKVGLAPVQREGAEYEFDVVGDINVLHSLSVTKTRCKELTDQVFVKPGKDFAKILWNWTQSGVTREQLNAQLERERAAKAAAQAGSNGTATVVAPGNLPASPNGNGAEAGSAEPPFPGDAIRSASKSLRVSLPAADAPVQDPLGGSQPGTPDLPPPWMTEDYDPPAPVAELGIPPGDDSGIPVETTYTEQTGPSTPPPAQIKGRDGSVRVVIDDRAQMDDHIAGILAEQGMPTDPPSADPPAQSGEKKKPGAGAGVASVASEVYQEFLAKCAMMVADVPYYRNAQGGADMFRILRAVKAEGVDRVDRQTIDIAVAKVAARGRQHEAEEREKAARKAAKVEAVA